MAFQKISGHRKLRRTAARLCVVLPTLTGILYFLYLSYYNHTLMSTTYQTSRILRTDTCRSACQGSPPAIITNSSRPYAYVVGGQELKVVSPGTCVCVRVVVPPLLRQTKDGLDNYRPLPLWPADSLMVDLVQESSMLENGTPDPLYRDARVTVSVDNFRALNNGRFAGQPRVYEGTARLYDPGVYLLDARIEARDGQWNPEDKEPVEYIEEDTVLCEDRIRVKRDPRHPTYLGRHQNLPLCVNGDDPGRWVPEKNLPRHWHKWAFVYPAEDGRVWLPYLCRLRRISHAEFVFHMSYLYPSVHWYGDSNSRRTLRPLVSAGKWCHRQSIADRLDCLCNDAPKDIFPEEWYAGMPVPHWYRIHTHGINGSEIYMDLRPGGGRTDPRPILEKDPADDRYLPDYVPPGYANRNDHYDLYYLFTRGTLDMYGSYWARDITPQTVSKYPKASLVVFQMITWDVAFGRFGDFVQQTALLVRRLKHVYPNAQFVYRSAPFWCCRAPDGKDKKYSRLRFLAFDRHARAVFRRHLDADVWDVQGPAAQRSPESKRLEENIPCRSAHSRAEVIHIDNQLLMNMLINRV
ncbi:hypothetical protein LPJ57_004020 [Coemansia sp. RSA 486]|nr:hypothetical protein LPJ57_004020 [Coemansia sp. RSA 486]KAJ2227582.1 hypothetical protein IWW45_006970 [Coemansia sp. RSA 485]